MSFLKSFPEKPDAEAKSLMEGSKTLTVHPRHSYIYTGSFKRTSELNSSPAPFAKPHFQRSLTLRVYLSHL